MPALHMQSYIHQSHIGLWPGYITAGKLLIDTFPLLYSVPQTCVSNWAFYTCCDITTVYNYYINKI